MAVFFKFLFKKVFSNKPYESIRSIGFIGSKVHFLEQLSSKKLRYKFYFKLSFLFLSILALFSCQTHNLKQFEKISNGMEKNDVIEIMGSPTTSLRFHGKDRWIYVFYEDQIRYEKEIHFSDNSVSYKGNKWEPSAGNEAAVVDLKNQKQDIEIEASRKARADEIKNSYDNFQYAPQKEDNSNRYMPDFEPVK